MNGSVTAKHCGHQVTLDELNESVAGTSGDVVAGEEGLGRLCRTQDVYQLLHVFVTEVRKMLSFDGIVYWEDTLGLSYSEGTIASVRTDYSLKLGEQLLGTISFSRGKAFEDQEQARLEGLIAGLMLPLRNAIRYQKAIRYALRDDLTGLRNSNAYYDNIGIEIQRAERYRIPFSLLLINLDDFADVNERYGHNAGNEVLVEVASRLERDARNSDIAFRKGGDEFLLFLPNTAQTAATIVAARIKHALLSGPYRVDGVDIRFTVSIGVVTVMPDDSPFSLIDRADQALYHAKILGKDRIQTEVLAANMFRE